MRAQHPLAIGAATVARLAEYAAAHMGGAVPDQLCKVLNALANVNM